MALTIAYNGANTTTKDAISRTLGFTPAIDEDINQSFKSLTELLHESDKAIVFKSANSIWHTDKIMLQKDFIAANKQYFDASVQGLNFIDPASKDIINGWVREKQPAK